MADCEKVMILQWAESPPIPQGTKPLAHQVAGHVFGRDNGHKKNKIGKFVVMSMTISLDVKMICLEQKKWATWLFY